MFDPQAEICESFRLPMYCKWLKWNGAWPLRSSGAADTEHQRSSSFAFLYSVWTRSVIFGALATFLCQIAFLIANLDDIVATTESCCTTLMGSLTLVRLLHIQCNKRKFKALIDRFVRHIWIRKNSHPDIEGACEKRMKIFLIVPILPSIVLAAYCIMPLVSFAESGGQASEKRFPFRMSFPYDAYHGWNYVLTYIFISSTSVCAVTTLIAEDTLFAFFLVYTCGQYRVLHRRINQLMPRSVEAVAARATHGRNVPEGSIQQEYKSQLHSVAAMHKKLIIFAEKLEHFASPILFANFISSSLLLCVVAFQLVTARGMLIADFVKLFLYVLYLTWQLYALCWSGDLLMQHSSATAAHFYGCNWESPQIKRKAHDACARESSTPDNDFRMQLRLMIMRSQKPSKLTALKFSDLSLTTFTKILSTSISYFTLLQAVYSKKK